MLIDRMVNLLSRGCVVPVVCYIKQCWQRGDTDVSLIRYFVTEVGIGLIVSVNTIQISIDFSYSPGTRGYRTPLHLRVCTTVSSHGRR